MSWKYTIDDFKAYQKYTIVKAIKRKHTAIFLGTGLGKTIIALTIVDQLLKRDWIKSALVVCTKKAMYNTWRQEAKLWKHTQYLQFSIIHGDAGHGPSEYVKKRHLFQPAHIYLINYEGLPWLSETFHHNYHNRPLPFQCIFYDESTKIKHSTTQRFKKFKKWMNHFTYRYPMTGVPTPNGLMDLYGQMYVMDLGTSLGTTLSSFRSRFFMAVPQQNYCIHRPLKGAKKAVSKRIKDRTIYLRKQDYVKLPSITYNKILLDLPDKLRSKYDELETTFFLELEKARVEAFSKGALSMKLRQFLQGKVYTGPPENRRTVKIHTEKLQMIEEVMEGIGNCIVAYNFRFERDDLQSVFKNAPAIEGRTTDKQAEEYIKQWNLGQVPVLLYNPASDPHGLNLQFGGHNILWYGLTWNLEHYIQLIDRLWRQGQKHKVFVHQILFRDTIDEVVFEALSVKDADQQTLLNYLKQYKEKKGGE